MFTPELLEEKVENVDRRRSPGGVDCKFVKLNEKWGIKIYRWQATRDRAYDYQLMMSGCGLAPEVGISFDVGNSYCYITEIAEPIMEGYIPANWPSYDDWEYTLQNSYDVYADQIEDVVKEMKKNGCLMNDAHPANFGWLRGKLVCIDFGHARAC